MYLLPKTIVKRLDRTRKRFFWQGSDTKKKYYLVKWTRVNKPKRKGGLGIHDLRKMNESLLCKWWWKLETKDGLWQQIVREKYIKMGPIAQLKRKPTNSPI